MLTVSRCGEVIRGGYAEMCALQFVPVCEMGQVAQGPPPHTEAMHTETRTLAAGAQPKWGSEQAITDRRVQDRYEGCTRAHKAGQGMVEMVGIG